MGDIKVFNSAGENDSENTITSSGSVIGRVKDLYMLKSDITELETKVDINTTNYTNLTKDAPEEMDTLKEISDNLDFNSFLEGFEPKPASGLDITIAFLAPTD